MRLVIVLGAIAATTVTACLIRCVYWPELPRRILLLKLHQRLCQFLLAAMNVRVTFENRSGRPFTGLDKALLLPNHISYLDVVVLHAHAPATFVTSREIEETPGLGQITSAGGCIFVERRHKWDVLGDIDQMSRLLNAGLNVGLFPEGSTSPGPEVGAFKNTLLESAVRSRCRILPVAIQYDRVDGERYDRSNQDLVAWYGDMTFLPHLWRLMRIRTLDVRVTVLDEVPFRAHKSRKRIARDVKASIARQLSEPPAP